VQFLQFIVFTAAAAAAETIAVVDRRHGQTSVELGNGFNGLSVHRRAWY
jgi:hypothetical protein